MFKLEKIVPWGRSFDEYVRMFAFSEKDLEKRILSCADGPAGFNAGMKKLGYRVISCDPLYRLSAAQIKKAITESFDKVMEQSIANKKNFIWKNIKSPEELGHIRMLAMSEFLKDFDTGKKEGRYLPESLPVLTFPDKHFDLAVCSHFLFLYSACLNLDFHLQAITEMSRLAGEVRIFPLLDLDGNESPYVNPVIAELKKLGYKPRVRRVKYEFQRGGNKMLQIK